MKRVGIFNQAFSAADTAWLHMDTPTNLSMINGVITFTEPLNFERLIATMESRLLVYKRFRQKVHEPIIGPPRWEYDQNFNIRNHLIKTTLPDPGDHEMLQRLVSEMMSVPLDRSKPLWELHYVENYGKGSALICRFHHCMADGIALIQILLSAADLDPDAPLPEPYDSPFTDLSPLARMFVPMILGSRSIKKGIQMTTQLFYEGFEILVDRKRMQQYTASGWSVSKALGKLLLILPDKKTLLKAECGISKKAIWSKAIKVSEVKKIGQFYDGTINDVLMAAMTGAIRQYLISRGESVEGLNIRAIVPVNLRTESDTSQLGNRFGLVFLSLPIGIEDPLKRFVILKQRMDKIKATPEAIAAFGIINFMGISPSRVENLIRDVFGLKGSMVITNVPGPQEILYLAGGKIDGLMFWVPTPANLSLGLSILSYAGEVIVGVATDAGIIPDPESIVNAFQDEFEQMKDWGIDEGKIKDKVTEQKKVVVDTTTIREGYCQALTRKGLPCKNKAIEGTQYCRVHSG